MKALSQNAVIALICAAALQSQAQIVTLSDGNSTALIDPTTSQGMYNWSVQGQNYLSQQWFWYGLGGGAVAPINTISAPSVTLLGTREVLASYAGSGFTVSVDYLLTGGTGVGVGQTAVAGIGESIRIINTGASPLAFHFYQYSDFDLGAGGLSDTVQLGTNLRGLFNEALQSNPNVGLTETVTTPGAQHGEVALHGVTLARLNSGLPVTLTDAAGPVGPGDVTWALQWDLNIAPGGSVLISKDKYLSVMVVPEPSAIALLGLGMGACLLRRRKI